MRFLFAALLSLLILWAGFWVVGQRYLTGQIESALGAEFSPSLALTHAGFDIDGFPSRFDLTLKSPEIRDLLAGWAWSGDFAQVFAMTWKPWHLIAALPDQQTITTPLGPAALTTSRMVGSLRVAPSAEISLQEAVIEVEDAGLRAAYLPEIAMDKLVLALRADPGAASRYRFGLALSKLSPLVMGPVGPALSMAQVDLVIDLSQPLDRWTGQTAMGVTGLELRQLELDWGDVNLAGSGAVQPDATGQASGEILVKITGWKSLPARLADFALVQPDFVPSLTRALEIIASEQGNPAVLTLPLSFSDGWMSLAGLPLGPAPFMDQRQ